MENNNTIFSMGDLEKGLMLLGLITPKSIEELEEKEELSEYEQKVVREKSNTYFKRAVLGAEIVSKLREEPTFGRIKFQKLVYLCEHISNMELSRYTKHAAGPFDNKFMHSINNEFKKQKWFETKNIKNGDYIVPKYFPLENLIAQKNYYKNYFANQDSHIQFIIELFRYKKTEETELAATVLACALELIATDRVSLDALIEIFYGWHDKKKRFKIEQIVSSFEWLKEKSILPQSILL